MVKWTDKAKTDLYGIHDFISQDNPDAANKVIEGIFNAGTLIDQNPLLGRVVPELSFDNIREIIHKKKYRIMYLIADDESVEILQVRHTSQQL